MTDSLTETMERAGVSIQRLMREKAELYREIERLEIEVKQMGRLWGEECHKADALQAKVEKLNAVYEAAKTHVDDADFYTGEFSAGWTALINAIAALKGDT